MRAIYRGPRVTQIRGQLGEWDRQTNKQNFNGLDSNGFLKDIVTELIYVGCLDGLISSQDWAMSVVCGWAGVVKCLCKAINTKTYKKIVDQWNNGRMDQWTNGPMDEWINGPMQWTKRPMDQ